MRTLKGTKDESTVSLRNDSVMSLSGLRILMVDDDHEIMHFIQFLLQGTGAVLDCVDNGYEAIKRVQFKAYDLVLMDIQMPEINGIETTLRLRQLGLSCPVVACTGNLEKAKQMAPLETFAGFLSKTISRSALIKSLHHFSGALGSVYLALFQ